MLRCVLTLSGILYLTMNDKMNNEDKKSPTDVLIKALEEAENMTDVIVIYKIKTNTDDFGILGWSSTIENTTQKIGILEETKINIVRNAYIERSDS